MGRRDLMGTAEIAARLGVTTRRAQQIVERKGFPDPVATLVMGRVWESSDVEAWIAKNRPAKR